MTLKTMAAAGRKDLCMAKLKPFARASAIANSGESPTGCILTLFLSSRGQSVAQASAPAGARGVSPRGSSRQSVLAARRCQNPQARTPAPQARCQAAPSPTIAVELCRVKKFPPDDWPVLTKTGGLLEETRPVRFNFDSPA